MAEVHKILVHNSQFSIWDFKSCGKSSVLSWMRTVFMYKQRIQRSRKCSALTSRPRSSTSVSNLVKNEGPYPTDSAEPSVTPLSLLVWDHRSYYFPVQHPHCSNSKCTCTPQSTDGHEWGVVRHIVGKLLSWGMGKWLRDRPTKTWSQVNGAFHCYFKGPLWR